MPSDRGLIEPAFRHALMVLDRFSIAALIGRRLPVPWTTFIDCYVLSWALVLTVVLFSVPPIGFVIAAVAIYRMADILVTNLRILLEDRAHLDWTPASGQRSMLLLLINVYELTTAFAIVYRNLGSMTPSSQDFDAITALYYSLTTFSTLGYGDLTPADGRTKVIVISQILTSITFLITILPTLTSAVQEHLHKGRATE